MDAHIKEKGTLAISGIAWSEGVEPPYLTDDAHVSLLRVNEMSYYVRWTPVISAEDYILQEATQPDFEPLTLNESLGDTSRLVSKLTGEEGTYYYRVQAVALDTEPRTSRWSNVVSVTVPWVETLGGASVSAVTAGLATTELMTVEVRTGEVGDIESSNWHTAEVTATGWGGWEWSYEWVLPQRDSTRYLIQTRSSEGGGVFGSADTLTVTVDNEAFYVHLPILSRRWPPVPYPPALDNIQNPDQDVSYLISWSYDDGGSGVPDPTAYTLQEANNPDFADPTEYYPIGSTSFTITDEGKEKEDGTYYYRVRGHNAYGAGEWSNVRSTVVLVLPQTPTLNDIENEDQDGDYTVSWSYGYSYPPVTSYTLREARDADFTTDVQDYTVDSGASRGFVDKQDGTYYYKVRANNDYGPGAWSSVGSVDVVTAYRDDFDDSDSGWEVRRTSAPDLDDMDVRYKDGKLYTKSDDNYDFGIFSPLVEAPPPPYRIRMKTKLHDGVYVPTYGIVFRAEKGGFCPVDRGDAKDDDGCFFHYFRINVAVNKWGEHIKFSVKRVEEHVDRGKAEGKDLSDGYHNIDNKADWDGWNEWEIEVHEEWFKVSVNDEHLGTYYDDDYAEDGYFGILTDNYEFAPAEFKHEYFYIEPID
jgi:hypothetical protein